MNDYIKAAIGRYKLDYDYIAPISEQDAKIIDIMTSIFEKIGFIQITELMKNYKFEPDEEILESIKVIGESVKQFAEKNKDSGGWVRLPRYIIIDGKRIDLFLIISYDSDTMEDGTPIVRFNPTPENAKNVPMYANLVIKFPTKRLRDEYVEHLDQYFNDMKGLFLNSEIK